MTVTLSWYVPPTGNHPYSLLIQRQASTQPEVDLTIQSTSEACQRMRSGSLHFQGVMDEDRRFTPSPAARGSCNMATRV
ncbi:hypothetical protein KDH_57090 [Dictyobacter sp. S3.2.2.5]|uniref:Uncharacterized protein n=1 Tax=Dictyobacter halimunensis TaxID=3026934 RepID=A0ABQ6FZ32_9CHLR|nr:hypothetical protein KDH_57090 [Dictyobacter sp. S3.2.2.5]